jgi:hypothetical protein
MVLLPTPYSNRLNLETYNILREKTQEEPEKEVHEQGALPVAIIPVSGG